ncbi:hypothetical protein ABZ352_23730 [Streptomyces griseofuscus]|uniref:hypothetical protein n=1 Tax=Streptomyces griseofuscus TaxID=146922 RepID=UPI0033D97021
MSELTGAALRNGVEPSTVYERPFVQTWTALSHDVPFDEALTQGESRLKSIAETDLQLARTHTSRAVMDQMPQVTYWVRKTESDHPCALCLLASTQRYHKGNLLAIHPGCHCEVDMIKGDDPGQVLNEEKLAAIHKAVEAALGTSDRGGRAVDYRKVVITHDHGEIGPVLGFRGQHFTSRTDITIPT